MQLNTVTRNVRIATALGMLLALVLLVACTSPADSTAVPEGGPKTTPGSPPTLRLTQPTAGATVPAGTVAVVVDTTGLTFVMPSNTNVAGEGHVHFTLDDRPLVMSTTPDAELKDVEPGEHTLVAELVQNDTKPFDPPIRETIEFVAE